jgi:hypothetical protein
MVFAVSYSAQRLLPAAFTFFVQGGSGSSGSAPETSSVSYDGPPEQPRSNFWNKLPPKLKGGLLLAGAALLLAGYTYRQEIWSWVMNKLNPPKEGQDYEPMFKPIRPGEIGLEDPEAGGITRIQTGQKNDPLPADCQAEYAAAMAQLESESWGYDDDTGNLQYGYHQVLLSEAEVVDSLFRHRRTLKPYNGISTELPWYKSIKDYYCSLRDLGVSPRCAESLIKAAAQGTQIEGGAQKANYKDMEAHCGNDAADPNIQHH